MIGDCTLGTDVNFSPMNSFTAYQNMYGNQYFFEKVRRILEADDGTFANLEGTLTTADTRANKTFAFRGDPSYTDILKDGSVEVVTLANNHSSDYGEQSLLDTEQNLTDAGIAWCKGDTIAYQDLNGVNCAFIGIYALENGLETLEQVKSSVKEAKGAGAEVIVVAFHWGAELVSDISDDQKTLAHTAIDEGATLVVGHHPHILGGIETYKNRYIVYSLANFCFGGSASPSSYDTIIFQ
jgi:poly-gamma-glutamate synthesis protein (capsule biosynthesis protein)